MKTPTLAHSTPATCRSARCRCNRREVSMAKATPLTVTLERSRSPSPITSEPAPGTCLSAPTRTTPRPKRATATTRARSPLRFMRRTWWFPAFSRRRRPVPASPFQSPGPPRTWARFLLSVRGMTPSTSPTTRSSATRMIVRLEVIPERHCSPPAVSTAPAIRPIATPSLRRFPFPATSPMA